MDKTLELWGVRRSAPDGLQSSCEGSTAKLTSSCGKLLCNHPQLRIKTKNTDTQQHDSSGYTKIKDFFSLKHDRQEGGMCDV